MWMGIVGVICGLAVVGLSDILTNGDKNKDTNGIIAGKDELSPLYILCRKEVS